MRKNITKEMMALEQQIQSQFTSLYCVEDFQRLLARLTHAAPDERPSILRRLSTMLTELGVPCPANASPDFYRLCVSKLHTAGRIAADRGELCDRLLVAICEMCDHYPTPVDYITRIVEQLDPRDTDEPLRLRIFKRLVSTVNVKAPGYHYYAPSLLSASVDDLTDALFEQETDKKADYARLLSGSAQLASGNLLSPVSTKELLFLFAFAYEMRYYPDPSASDYEKCRDVKQNLFVDYYSDNLARYLTSESLANGCSDKEPGGAFLSPKSFVDAAFLYSLNLKEHPDGTPYTPADRLRFFYQVLAETDRLWKRQHPSLSPELATRAANQTVRNAHTQITALLATEQGALAPFLADQYYCERRFLYTAKNGETLVGAKGFFALDFSSNTAYERYRSLVETLSEEITGDPHTDLTHIALGRPKNEKEFARDEDLYTLASLALQAHLPTITADRLQGLGLSDGQISAFLRILRHVCNRLQPTEAFSVDAPSKLTRTKQLAAYLHLYCFCANNRDGDWVSFGEVARNFSAAAAPYLEEVGFAPVSSKNLYDMLLIFIAYYEINELID